jgi:acyl carrier protein
MNENQLIEIIRNTLAEEFEVDAESIQPEAEMAPTLDLDSLDYVDLIVLIEQKFGVTAKGSDFVNLKTFQDFYDFLGSRMS